MRYTGVAEWYLSSSRLDLARAKSKLGARQVWFWRHIHAVPGVFGEAGGIKRRFFGGGIWVLFEPKKSPTHQSLGSSDKNYIRTIPAGSGRKLAK